MLVPLCLLLISLTVGLRTTPYGKYHPSCVHKVPSGSFVRTEGFHTIVEHSSFKVPFIVPKCRFQSIGIQNSKKILNSMEKRQFPPDYDGWLAYTAYKTTLPTFDTFLGNFSVPNNPSNYPDMLFIFTGLQNVDWIPIVDPIPPSFDIIQPVLQYPADQGNGWSVKSWYVTLDSGVLETSEILCNPGDIIFGNMTRIGGNNWFIGGTNTQTNQIAALTVSRDILRFQPWAYTTVECYGCTDCSTLPTNDLVFSGMSLSYKSTPIKPVWQTFKTPSPPCHTTAHVIDDTEVHFSFQ